MKCVIINQISTQSFDKQKMLLKTGTDCMLETCKKKKVAIMTDFQTEGENV